VITTLLMAVVERERWGWPALATLLFSGGFLVIDLAVWGANILKIPHVPPSERVTVEDIGHGFYRVVVSYGFMEDPNIPVALQLARRPGLEFRPLETSYFLGRENLIATRRKRGMAIWREKLFAGMSRNARSASSFFRLPPNRVVELGAQVEL
jgi:KUP system potassium uptake protein